MSEMNEGIPNAALSRREFFKAAAAATAAVAVTSVAVPILGGTSKAFAATGNAVALADMVEGVEYTVTANLYVAATDSPIGANAYVTNPGVPPFNKPTSPVANNATLVVQGDKKLLTVPLVNDTFGVLDIATASSDGSVKVTSRSMGTWTMPNFLWSAPYSDRIVSITFDVTNFAGGEAVATFSPSAEYASFPLYKGDKTWDLHLVADLSVA